MEGDDPVTIGLAAAGASVSAMGSVEGGLQAKEAALQQGRQDTEAGQVAHLQAGAEISGQTMIAAHTLSRVSAAAGAMGLTSGSATPILSEDYTQAKIRAAYTRFNGDLTASQDQYAAKLAKYQGNQAMWAGIFGATKGVLGSATSLAAIGAFGPGISGPAVSGAIPPPNPSSFVPGMY